jgi:heptosyltransferase-2
MPGRILVIRGGALGDFLLTLPAIRLLREGLPDTEVEILGYRQFVSLAEGRFYATTTRSIEYGPLAGFFSRHSDLSSELVDYFQSFALVISYLFDPDAIFAGNLARAGVKDLLAGPGKIQPHSHAVAQLAAPLAALALYLENDHLRVFPTAEDETKAAQWLNNLPVFPKLAMHPGSGGKRKNWPLARWVEFMEDWLARHRGGGLLVVGGEADAAALGSLATHFAARPEVAFLENQPLPHVAAVLSRVGKFVGHDSGITHLAAAAGCRGVALFGPTDPGVWAPPNPEIRVLRAPGEAMDNLELAAVRAAVEELA